MKHNCECRGVREALKGKAGILRRVLDDRGSGPFDILDARCGSKLLVKHLREDIRIRHLIALESGTGSDGFLAAEDIAGIEFLKWNEKRFPFPENSFDLVLSDLAVPFIPQANRFGYFSEIKRVMRSGGKIVVFEYNPWSVASLWGRNKKSRMIGASRIVDLLRRCGLKVIETRYLFFLSLFPGNNFFKHIPLSSQYCVLAEKIN